METTKLMTTNTTMLVKPKEDGESSVKYRYT